MIKIKKLFTAIAAAAVLFQSLPAFAAEAVNVVFVPDEILSSDDTFTMTYKLTGGTDITNGKMTITYDKNLLTLSDEYVYDEEKEESLFGTTTNMYDALNGNGEEGQIVFSFAGGSPVKAKGDIMDLWFDVKKELKAGDTFSVNIRVDELTNNGTVVNSVVKEQPVTVVADEDDEDDTEEETETKAKTPAKKQTQQTKSTTATNAPETTAKGANAKTGDVTKILPWVAAAFLAALILGGFVVSRKKEKKE